VCLGVPNSGKPIPELVRGLAAQCPKSTQLAARREQHEPWAPTKGMETATMERVQTNGGICVRNGAMTKSRGARHRSPDLANQNAIKMRWELCLLRGGSTKGLDLARAPRPTAARRKRCRISVKQCNPIRGTKMHLTSTIARIQKQGVVPCGGAAKKGLASEKGNGSKEGHGINSRGHLQERRSEAKPKV
jgi:hypothetical protein